MSLPDPSLFHPLVRKWFSEIIGAPSDIQTKAWPEIVRGNHVLVVAPTGSGKTLTAFLWGLNQLISGAWTGGTVRLLYVSPLKALNNDVQRNLLSPLSGLKETFAREAAPFPEISVLTRSGDTPGEERRRMVRRPPEILITTPESLNLLLTSRSGRSMLRGISTVIMDEIHAVIGSKRGTHLITAVDRLVLLSGEFQRVALSATVNPVERVADFVGGYRHVGNGGESQYEKRPVSIIRSTRAKSYDIRVSFPPDTREKMVDGSRWPALIDAFKTLIAGHRSTLLFTNSRRAAEKVTRLLNEHAPGEIAYAHHGSLAREIRLAVEQKLKNGELKAIVATNSLELGIDVGSLDQVILVQTPRTVSSALQRIGRSGHSVGRKSRGLIFPTHGRDFIDAAVTARAVLDQDIEAVRPVEAPIDVLAQVMLSMTATERWDIDDLYAFLRTSYPYRELPRRHYDILLEMLSGRYADTRLRELRARASLDRLDNTIEARSDAVYLIYTSGGTIPDRGYFNLRVKDSRARIGELDEEFVWERSIGETFTLGSQLWRIENITHNDVEVVPSRSETGIIPFWKAGELHRDFHLSEKIGLFLERADKLLGTQDWKDELIRAYAMEESAAGELIGFLKLQKEATGAALPHRHHLLFEYVEEPAGRGDLKQVILHTFWGGRVNRPFALALAQAWEVRYRTPLRIIVDDGALLLMLPHQADPRDILDLLSPQNVEAHLKKRLELSGFFGARFRENAERALLLPRSGFKRRMPLWLIRLRAKELLEAVRHYDDFPILIETWRTCLEEEFDLDNLKLVLEEIRGGSIFVSRTKTRAASPFAGSIVQKQTNTFMYEDDTPLTAKETSVRADLIKQLLFSSQLRPKIPAEVVRVLDQKLKRTAPGYAPSTTRDLLDWIKERMLIPQPEWRELAAAIRRDHDADAAAWLAAIGRKLAWASWPGVEHSLLMSLEMLPRILVAFRLLIDDIVLEPVSAEETGDNLRRLVKAYLRNNPGAVLLPEEYDLSTFLAAWFAYYGPVREESLPHLLGVTPERLEEAIEPLIEAQDLIMDSFGEESTAPEICDSDNLEMLLRMMRRYRRPSFQALPLEQLPLFLASFQGLARRGESMDDLQQRLEQLFGWPAPAEAWEEYILPSRIRQYRGEWLDSLLSASDLVWFGCGPRRISIAFSQDLKLFHRRSDAENGEDLEHLIPGRRGRYSFFEIAHYAHLDTMHATDMLWKEAWKGNVTSDTFRSIREGVTVGFKAGDIAEDAGLVSARSGFNRWKVSRPVDGYWHRIDIPDPGRDIVEEEELLKDRVRQLLKRHGLLFRELLANELQPLEWRSIFRSLRLMELAGEVLSGWFFEGISGPQFISHEAFRLIQEPLPQDTVFWINGADPASLCGLGFRSLQGLPPRLASNYLVYHGSRLVLTMRRLGKSIETFVPPDDLRISDYLSVFKELLTREFKPLSRITIETINGKPALRSPYVAAFKQFGFRSGRNALELWKEFSG